MHEVPDSWRDGELVAECMKDFDENHLQMDDRELGHKINVLHERRLLPRLTLLARMVAHLVQVNEDAAREER